MGDRANCVVIDGDSAVFLYTHWSGHVLPEAVRAALIRGRDRWNDETYLARIVFSEMIRGDEDSTTGYGISAKLTDNEYDLIVLKDQRVYRATEADASTGFSDLNERSSIPFEEFVADKRAWENLTSSVQPTERYS